TTGNRNRDSNMWEMLGFPQVQQITVLVPSASAKAGKAPVSFIVRMHGKEKSMTSDMNFEEQSGSVVVSGDFTVSLAEYDVTPPKLLMLKVGDAVLVRFRIAVPVQGK
ncbi:MAG TPA: YceI family protein, partial [Leptospiraceae bacterium]|nr:YceI family protein [Leptospiraceae bacterium]